MAWHETLIAALTAAVGSPTDPPISHSERLSSERYIVWQEDGSNDLLAGNGHAERAVSGVADLFSKQELDPWADAVGAAFDAAGIAWSLVMVDYEPETGFHHWSWDWEVLA